MGNFKKISKTNLNFIKILKFYTKQKITFFVNNFSNFIKFLFFLLIKVIKYIYQKEVRKIIDKFCNWMIYKIKTNVKDIDEEREAIIDFGVRLIFGELPKILILFIIGFLLNMGWQTLLLFFLIAPYRSFTGGFHLKTHIGCMITTSILYLTPIIIAKYLKVFHSLTIYVLAGIVAIFSIFIIAKYAPADTENMPILSKKERKSKKIKAYIMLAILLLIVIFIPYKQISYMIIYAIFLQNLTVLPISYRLTKSKYGYEVYTEETI